MEGTGADVVCPLTPAQLDVLRAEHLRLRRQAAAAMREVSFFARRTQHLEGQLKRCDVEIESAGSPAGDAGAAAAGADASAAGEGSGRREPAAEPSGVGPAAAPVSSPTAPDPAAAAAAARGAKRSRDEDRGAGGGKAPARGRPQLARGALFQRVAGHLAAARLDEARVAALDLQRREALRHAQLAQLRQSRAGVVGQHDDAAERLRASEAANGELQPRYEALNRTWREARLMEAAYSDAFFLKAKGPAFDVCFAPVAHTPASLALLDRQLLAAAAEYAPFRAAVDAVLAAAAERSAALDGADAASAAAAAETDADALHADSTELALPAAELDDDALDF